MGGLKSSQNQQIKSPKGKRRLDENKMNINEHEQKRLKMETSRDTNREKEHELSPRVTTLDKTNDLGERKPQESLRAISQEISPQPQLNSFTRSPSNPRDHDNAKGRSNEFQEYREEHRERGTGWHHKESLEYGEYGEYGNENKDLRTKNFADDYWAREPDMRIRKDDFIDRRERDLRGQRSDASDWPRERDLRVRRPEEKEYWPREREHWPRERERDPHARKDFFDRREERDLRVQSETFDWARERDTHVRKDFDKRDDWDLRNKRQLETERTNGSISDSEANKKYSFEKDVLQAISCIQEVVMENKNLLMDLKIFMKNTIERVETHSSLITKLFSTQTPKISASWDLEERANPRERAIDEREYRVKAQSSIPQEDKKDQISPAQDKAYTSSHKSISRDEVQERATDFDSTNRDVAKESDCISEIPEEIQDKEVDFGVDPLTP